MVGKTKAQSRLCIHAFHSDVGPIKAIPGFYAQSKHLEAGDRLRLAVKGTLLALAISLVLALIMPIVQAGWRVTTDDLRIATWTLLFMSAYQILAGDSSAPPSDAQPKYLALSPVAISIIITLWGAMAILMAMGLAGSDAELARTVVAMLFVIMALNLLGMLFAKPIVEFLGVGSFKLLGWIFAVLQAGLAVHVFVHALQNWGVITAPN
ncbi:MAG: MarC family protein [Methyloceanibacter sp.]|jgi:multiple antibiotic resistance protein